MSIQTDPRFASLVARGQTRLQPVTGEVVTAADVLGLSPVHRAVLSFLTDVMALIESRAAALPAAGRMVLRFVLDQRDGMAEMVGRIPEHELRGYLLAIRAKLDEALSA